MSTPTPHRIYPCGDHAVTIELGERIDAATNRKVISLFTYLQSLAIVGVRDIIPSYHSVTVVYDLELLAKRYPLPVFETMCNQLIQAADACTVAPAKSRLVQVPVCYAVSMAPDIESVAALHSLGVDEVIQLHTAKTYRVYMIGFLPGFAYMGSVDEKIITPRRSQPRIQVPKGSVGIAGEQTGIYPFDSPGGWQLIGQTPLGMFNIANEMPCYLQPGDEVQFYPITMAEFEKIKKA